MSSTMRTALGAAHANRESLGGGVLVVGVAAVGAALVTAVLGGPAAMHVPGVVAAVIACMTGAGMRQSARNEREGLAGPGRGHPDRI